MFVFAGQGDPSKATINFCANHGQVTRNFANVVMTNSRESVSWAPVKSGFHEPSSFGLLLGLDAARNTEPLLVAAQAVKAGSYASDDQGRCYYEITGFTTEKEAMIACEIGLPAAETRKVSLVAKDSAGKKLSELAEVTAQTILPVPMALTLSERSLPKLIAADWKRSGTIG